MDIRVRNIAESRGKRIKAIARVKFGIPVPDFVKILLADAESKYNAQEMQKILDLYDTIKDED